MAETAMIEMVVASLGPLFAAAIISIMKWLQSEAARLEQKREVKDAIDKMNQSFGQGDSLASMGMKLGGDLVRSAEGIPTLKPFIDKMGNIYNDAVKIWNDPNGSDQQMADAEHAFNECFEMVNMVVAAIPKKE